ncbi:hypothetical protein [Pontiella sulfatireligans]|nr:hypothetical protein [Pontiella sulfatireligans]
MSRICSTLLFCLAWLACSGSALALGSTDEAAVADYVKDILYWPDAADQNAAAFRYKVLLYTNETSGVRANTANMGTLYGTAERTRAQNAESDLRDGLIQNPSSLLLQNLLLDLYYDRLAAELILAGNMRSTDGRTADQMRMGPATVASGLVIDDEINLHEQALEAYQSALADGVSLLSDSLGLTNSPPAGYAIFKNLVPTRGLEPATYGTNLVSVTGSTTLLFDGYKDLVLLLNGLRDYGREAEAAGRLKTNRNNAGDRAEAKTLATDAARFLFLQQAKLLGLFPNLDIDDASGLAEASKGVAVSLAALESLAQSIRSGSSLLGFEDDFLMLVQKFTGQSADIFDSFDAYELRLNPTDLSSPLRYALSLQDSAVASYDDYRGYQDQLETQLSYITEAAEDRLYQLTGAYPGDPEFERPDANEGCEIWMQLKSIDIAKLQIQRNRAEISNLEEEVRIEVERSQSVQSTFVYYGNKQASLTEWIGHINAAQAFANELAAAADGISVSGGFLSATVSVSPGAAAHAVNSVVQAAAEEGKGQLEADKERLAAQENAKLENIENAAKVETLMLGMKTLAIDSQEAAILLTQELGRLAALIGEKDELERTLAESGASLAGRYFADPVHHLRSQHQTLLANLSFDEAQKWLYFMARALEYKWNTPFMNYFYLGRKWSTGTLYKLRNADELEQMYNAMASFNSLVQLPSDDYFDWFSVKEDFLGYYEFDDTGTNQLFYTDPANPDAPATNSATMAFRSYLRTKQDAIGNIKLTFSTRREIPGGTFYRGARRDANNNVLSAGLFLDKIKWLKINLPGNHSDTNRTQLAGELSYGGTGLIRNFDVGTFHPDRLDRLQNEETAYSTRYWYFHAPSAKWRFSEALSSPVTMQLSADPRVPPTVSEIDIFKERSVAATGWKLTVPTEDLGVPVLNIDELDDIELYFYHYAVSRQLPESSYSTMATMAEGEKAAPRVIPFPYNLRYE